MPFTPSHVAAVLPLVAPRLSRTRLVTSALIAGSMAPDVPVFLPGSMGYFETHSARGVFTLDVVIALAAVAVFHGVLRAPLGALLPRRLWDAFPPPGREPYGPRHLVVVPAAAALGAATHVFWDSFTHSYGARWWDMPWLDISIYGRLVGSSRVDLQACKLEYSIVSPK